MPQKRKSNLCLGKRSKATKYRKTLGCKADWNQDINDSLEFEEDQDTGKHEIDDLSFEENNYILDYNNNSTCTSSNDTRSEISIENLFNSALEKLKVAGKDYFLVQLFTLKANDAFPYHSICFNLFCEFIQWLSLKTSCGMRYSESTKEFWWTGKMLFGGKFIRFMEGFKHKGAVQSNKTTKGFYDPMDTSINFSVPSENILSKYCPLETLQDYKSSIPPGIIQPMLDMFSDDKSNVSSILTFDGKKIIPNTAGIDLLGCEDEGTSKLKQTIKSDNECKISVQNVVEKLQSIDKETTNELTENDKQILKHDLERFHGHISEQHQIVRELSNKKKYAISKLKERNTVKEEYLLNHLQTFVYQCDNTTKELLENVNSLCHIMAVLNGSGSSFVKQSILDLNTLLGKIIPVLFPGLVFCEEGVYLLESEQLNKMIIAVSPDGSLRSMRNDGVNPSEKSKISIEIKCPYNVAEGEGGSVYSSVPKRYLCQCLLEQTVTKSTEHIFVCWTPQSTLVWKVPYDHSLVQNLLQEIVSVYYADIPHRPTKLSLDAKKISKQIDELHNKCELIAEFPSITNVKVLQNDIVTMGSPYTSAGSKTVIDENITIEEICHVLIKTQNLIESMTKLYNKKASEAVVFSISDTNRVWQRETGHSLPIGYFFRGYSLSTQCMRDISDKVLQSCIESSLHVPCTTFDGQWYKLKDEASDGSPLTIFQLMRNYWKTVCSLSKEDLLDNLCDVRNYVFVEKFPISCNVNMLIGDVDIEFGIELYSNDRPLNWPLRIPRVNTRKKVTAIGKNVEAIIADATGETLSSDLCDDEAI